MSAETIDVAGVAITRDEPREYRKVATVRAGPALRGGVMPTLEGDHSYEAGDYICGPGAGGEVWPVKRAIFEATYQPVATTPSPAIPEADQRGVRLADFLAESSYLRCAPLRTVSTQRTARVLSDTEPSHSLKPNAITTLRSKPMTPSASSSLGERFSGWEDQSDDPRAPPRTGRGRAV